MRNRSNTLQVTKQPTTHMGNEITKNSKRVESKDKNGIKILQHIVNIGEKYTMAMSFDLKTETHLLLFLGYEGKQAKMH